MEHFTLGKKLYEMVSCSECGTMTETFCDEVSLVFCPHCGNSYYTTKDVVVVTNIDHENSTVTVDSFPGEGEDD